MLSDLLDLIRHEALVNLDRLESHVALLVATFTFFVRVTLLGAVAFFSVSSCPTRSIWCRVCRLALLCLIL